MTGWSWTSRGSKALTRRTATSTRTRRLDRRALGCLLLLGAVLAGGLVLVLADEAPRRAGTNGVVSDTVFSAIYAGGRVCQGRELLPAGTSAVRLRVPVARSPGPTLAIELRRRGRLLARTTGQTRARDFLVVASIAPPAHDVANVTLCYTVGASDVPAAVVGGYAPPGTGTASIDGVPQRGAIEIEYLRSGAESWWSFAPLLARRIGMGRGDWGGAWTAWLAAALVLAAIALAVRAVVRTVLADAPAREREPVAPTHGRSTVARARRAVRRVPPVAGTVAAVGVLNALAWSLITPVFQVPEEQAHLAYVQQVAENGSPGVDRRGGGFSAELTVVMLESRFGWLGTPRKTPAVWSPLQERRLQLVLHAGLSPKGDGDVGAVAPEPPLFYALEAIPYRLAHGATLLDRLAAMRVLTALMAGATAFFMLLFVRECMPHRPWAWTVGGLGAAFVPLLGFVSGGVNPDALLFPVCAALFLCIARAFRRGLTMRLAIWIGVVLGIGAIAKINFYGLVPGAIVAMALAARAHTGAWNARAARLVAIAVTVGAAPYVLVSALDALVWDRAFILARTPSAIHQDLGGLWSQLSYLWQVYLPRLPGQTPAFPELSPTYDLWVSGFLGRFGWVSVYYPSWAYRLGEGALIGIALLALRALVVERAALRRRAAELTGYLLMAGGMLLLIGMVALRGWAPGIQGAVQGRYVLPLLALFAALLALAARGAGDRWGRAVGVAIVLMTIAWSLAGQLLTVAFYYG